MRQFQPTVPLFIAFLGIYFLSNLFAQDYIFERIQFDNYSAADSPPWYFIHQDVATAIANSLGILLLLIITFYFQKKDLASTRIILLPALIFMVHPILLGIVILFGTRRLFDVERATTVWQTHEAYLNTCTIFAISYLAILFIAVFLKKRREKRRIANAY